MRFAMTRSQAFALFGNKAGSHDEGVTPIAAALFSLLVAAPDDDARPLAEVAAGLALKFRPTSSEYGIKC
jgi:hypothetical protein